MTPVTPPDGVFLNDPITMPPADFDPSSLLRDPRAAAPGGGSEASTSDVSAAIAKTTKTDAPAFDERDSMVIDLPGGYLADGHLYSTARVRELTGYDEEKLSRLDSAKNAGVFVTELLMLGVEDLGGEPPTKEAVRNLLIGDRDALVIGVRRATYGNLVEFTINECAQCGAKSEIEVVLDEDIKTTVMEDPKTRVFIVPLRHGEAKVTLLTGVAQEAFSEDLSRRTRAELDSIVLSKSVIEINGEPVRQREGPVKSLSGADRATLTDFINKHQPGPKFEEIPVACATCGAEYPISLGFQSLFRF